MKAKGAFYLEEVSKHHVHWKHDSQEPRKPMHPLTDNEWKKTVIYIQWVLSFHENEGGKGKQ